MSELAFHPPETAEPAYTAAQLGTALGRKRQAIWFALRNTPATGQRLASGNLASVWRLSALPESLRADLDALAKQKGYRGAVEMLQSPPKLWHPSLPLGSIADHCLDKAARLQRAMANSLRRRNEPGLGAAELARQGLEDYRREFGHNITGRYWQDLFKRTLDRDAGAENWTRPEIYLDVHLARKNPPPRNLPDSFATEFAAIADCIGTCSNPAKPTKTERRAVWTLAFEHYHRAIGQGIKPKTAKRRIRQFLFAKAPFLSPTREALLKAFDRNLARLHEAGAGGLLDGREENTGNDGYELPENDRDLIIHRAVFQYRGDVAPAWRGLVRDKELSTETIARYGGGGQRKSYVPNRIMDSVGPEVEILTVMHRGPRAYDDSKGYVTRSYEGIASYQCIMADDFTMPVYFYVPDGNGWFKVTRGQTLIFIDFRSSRVLGWSLQPDRNYNSLVIRTQCTKVFSEHRLPEILYFERGIWQRASLITGKEPGPLSFVEVCQGLREFGIEFKHAIRARSKTVERIGGMLQDLMEGEPGYCGRDERKDAPETLRKQIGEVEARKVHPERYFYCYEQWNKRLEGICTAYNNEPQQGRICAGLSPEACLEANIDKGNPPREIDARIRFLLAHDKRVVRVTLNGITIQIGKQKFNYRGLEIKHLVGRDVLAWFDPHPDNVGILAVTDMNRKNPICVSRSNEVSALESLTDPGSENLAHELQRVEYQAEYMKARFNVLKTKFALPSRLNLVAARTVELGRAISEQKQALQIKTQAAASRLQSMQRLAGRVGVPAKALDSDPARVEEGADMMDKARCAAAMEENQ